MSRRIVAYLSIMVIALCFSLRLHASETASANYQRVFDLLPEFEDLAGNPINLGELSEGKILVLRFWTSRCPHALSFDKVTEEMFQQYKADAVILDVNSNARQDHAASRERRIVSALSLPMIVDERSLLARVFAARTNAEYFVFDPDKNLIYRGTYDIEAHHPEYEISNVHCLIGRIATGERVPRIQGPSFGCFIAFNPIVKLTDIEILKEANEISFP